MQFSDIPGQEELKKQLINSHSKKKVAHAQLFNGNAGTTVLPMALAYATYLMCTNKGESDSCGTCPNCVRMAKFIHPDIHWFFPKVAASDGGKYEKVLAEALPQWRIFMKDFPFGSLDDWSSVYGQENKNLQLSREDSRQILKQVSMRSVEGGYKIIFVWGAEFMHPAGANAILKVLEEPPENTIYLLVAFNYDLLLQTIISRTQLVSIPPSSREDISQYLMERKGAEESNAKHIAKISQGKIGMALKLLQGDEEISYHRFRDWMLACWNRDITFLVKESEEFSKVGKMNQRGFLSFSLSLIRSAMLKVAGSQQVVLNQEEDTFITKYAERLGLFKLEEMYGLLNQAIQHLDRNSNPRITHLNLSLAILRRING